MISVLQLKPSDSVNAMLERGFPVSFELGITAIIIAVISGLALGIMLSGAAAFSIMRMSLAVLGISIPNFIMATLLIQQFAVHLKWFPAATWTSPVHMVLPTVALAVGPIYREADKIKHGRSADSGLHPHGKSKGAFSRQNCDQTRIKNALMPVVTVLGTLAASILTGSFVIEKILPYREWANIS